MEIISHLRESNTFVLSSHVETFSVVCIEALSIGVPVIATACGGPEEFIQRTDGLLVKPGSVDELSSAMLQMYQNYKITRIRG
jgi:glycosyltransferase involved in cell wall biosynthesis